MTTIIFQYLRSEGQTALSKIIEICLLCNVLRIFSSIILGSKTRSWPCYLFYVLSVVAVFLGVDRVPEDIPERIWTKWRNESLGVHDEPARSHRSRKYLSALLAAESIGFISKRTVQGGRPRLIHVPAADRCSTDGRPLEMVEAYSLLAQPAKRPIPTSLHPSPPNPSAIPAYSIDPRVGGSVPPSPTEDLRKSYLDLGHANQHSVFPIYFAIAIVILYIIESASSQPTTPAYIYPALLKIGLSAFGANLIWTSIGDLIGPKKLSYNYFIPLPFVPLVMPIGEALEELGRDIRSLCASGWRSVSNLWNRGKRDGNNDPPKHPRSKRSNDPSNRNNPKYCCYCGVAGHPSPHNHANRLGSKFCHCCRFRHPAPHHPDEPHCLLRENGTQ